jgi:hypothetical protein
MVGVAEILVLHCGMGFALRQLMHGSDTQT